MTRIRNQHIKNYLEENGIQAEYTVDEISFYQRIDKLFSLLDKYYIEFLCIPNKI